MVIKHWNLRPLRSFFKQSYNTLKLEGVIGYVPIRFQVSKIISIATQMTVVSFMGKDP